MSVSEVQSRQSPFARAMERLRGAFTRGGEGSGDGRSKHSRRPPPSNHVLQTIAAVLGFIVLAIVLFLYFFEWNWLRGPIGRFASAKLEREVRLEGDLHVDIFSWTPTATVQGLTIAQPAWGPKDRKMVDLGRMVVSVELMPLLKGDVNLPILRLERAVIDVRVNKQGETSWTFGEKKENEPPGKMPLIRQFVMEGGRVNFVDEKRDLRFTGVVTSRERQGGGGNEAFKFDGEGKLKQEPFKLTVRGGPLIHIRRDRPYPFVMTVTAGATKITADGSIPKPFDIGLIEARLSAQGDDMADLYDLTGVTTPNTPPYRVSGRLRRDETLWKVTNFAGKVGDSDVGGVLTLQTKGERPHLDADLVSRKLDLDDLGPMFGAPPDTRETASPKQRVVAQGMINRLLPDATLDTERLRAMDADVKFRATDIIAPKLKLRQASVVVDLDDGLLKLNPISMKFPQGEMAGSASLNGRGSMPVTEIDLRLRGLNVEQLIPAKGGAAPLEGALSGRAKLRGSGNSVRAAAQNAVGDVSIVMPRGRMRQAFAELLGINASKGLLLLLGKDQRETPVRCAVGSFRVANGRLTSQSIVIDTDVVLARGAGSIDLNSEAMNFRIDGDSKKPRLLRVWSPVLIRGTMRKPEFGVEPAPLVAQGGIAVALGALINPIAAILPFIEPGLAKDADCGALIASGGTRGVPTKGR